MHTLCGWNQWVVDQRIYRREKPISFHSFTTGLAASSYFARANAAESEIGNNIQRDGASHSIFRLIFKASRNAKNCTATSPYLDTADAAETRQFLLTVGAKVDISLSHRAFPVPTEMTPHPTLTPRLSQWLPRERWSIRSRCDVLL